MNVEVKNTESEVYHVSKLCKMLISCTITGTEGNGDTTVEANLHYKEITDGCGKTTKEFIEFTIDNVNYGMQEDIAEALLSQAKKLSPEMFGKCTLDEIKETGNLIEMFIDHLMQDEGIME